jgi:hypothetical protein
MLSTLYVGAGVDIPVAHVPTDELLVCVDSQPFSEFGLLRCRCHPNDDTHCYSRLRFLADLDQSASRVGLQPAVERADGNVREYGPRVRYYTNTAFPEHMSRLRSESPFTSLLVRGHHPHRAAMDMLVPRDATFIGFTGTVYSLQEEEDTVVTQLHTCSAARERFRWFVLIDDVTGCRLHCADWFDFVRISQGVSTDTIL